MYRSLRRALAYQRLRTAALSSERGSVSRLSTKPSQPPAPGAAVPGSASLQWLIPGIGLPLAAAWYAYQWYLEDEHSARIQQAHREIEQSRAGGGLPSLSRPAPAPDGVQGSLPQTSLGQGPGSEDRHPRGMGQVGHTAAPAWRNEQAAGADVQQPASVPGLVPQPDITAEPAPAIPSKPAAAHALQAGARRSEQVSPHLSGTADQVVGVVLRALDQQQQQQQHSAQDEAADQQVGQAQATPGTGARGAESEADVPGVDSSTAGPQHHQQQQLQGGHRVASATGGTSGAEPLQQQHEGGLVAAAVAHAAAGGYELGPGLGPPPVAGEVPPPHVSPGHLGVTLDLSPAGLIQHAIQSGQGAGEDWEGFKARHKQVLADAELFMRAAAQIEAWHASELRKVQGVADAHAKRAEDVVAAAQAAAESFKRLLAQHQAMATELRELEVRQAERRAALSEVERVNQERKERAAQLDEVRAQLNALSAAHEARSSQQAASATAHTLTLGILGVGAALEAGAPLSPALRSLTAAVRAAQGGPEELGTGAGRSAELVTAAAASIPARPATKGIATMQELTARFQSMRSTVSALATFPLRLSPASHISGNSPGSPSSGVEGAGKGPAGAGGPLSHALARLAAWLKADEGVVVRSFGKERALAQGGADAALAAAEALLAAGRPGDAASALEAGVAGTAAAAAVGPWCEEARARGSADQALTLLRAQAVALAASVV